MKAKLFDLRGLPAEVLAEAMEIAQEFVAGGHGRAWTQINATTRKPESLVLEFGAERGA